MKGRMLTILPNTGRSAIADITQVPALSIMKEAVGGSIEAVPYFQTIEIDGAVVPCVAFVNTYGKPDRLPVNMIGTQEWEAALQRRSEPLSLKGPAGSGLKDYLVGPVFVLTGDDEFMKEI